MNNNHMTCSPRTLDSAQRTHTNDDRKPDDHAVLWQTKWIFFFHMIHRANPALIAGVIKEAREP